ncbi:MAG: 50S ribosomal protein L29 [Anaerolineaceae bacterium]
MKATDLRDLTVDELNQTIAQRRKDLYQLRSQNVTGHMPNPHLVRLYRKDIARCMTILTEKAKVAGGATS